MTSASCRSSPARAKGLSLAGLEIPGQPASDRDARRYLAVPTLGAYEIGLDGDINGDGYVNVGDLQTLVAAWGSQETPASTNWNARADVNGDTYVNVGDLPALVTNWGRSG